MSDSIGLSKKALDRLVTKKWTRPRYVYDPKPVAGTVAGDQRQGVAQPRNSPCRCGSNKKYKQCCAFTNSIVENLNATND